MKHLRYFNGALKPYDLQGLERPFLFIQAPQTIINEDGSEETVPAKFEFDRELTIKDLHPDMVEVTTNFDMGTPSDLTKYPGMISALKPASYFLLQNDVDANNNASFAPKYPSTTSGIPKSHWLTTVDLNGHTLTIHKNVAEALSPARRFKFLNGTIEWTDEYNDTLFNCRQDLVLENITFTHESAVKYFLSPSYSSKKVTLIGCHISVKQVPVILNGKLYDCKFILKDCVLDCPDVDKAMYIGGSDNGKNRTYVELDGCTINAKSGVEFKHCDVKITNCTFNVTSAPAYHRNGNGSCTNGYAVSLTTNGAEINSTGSLEISGCTFNLPEATEPVFVAGEKDAYKTISVKGASVKYATEEF